MEKYDNSKLACWRTCPKKYFWTHLYGGQGIVHPPSDALKYGSCFHEGLAEYYRTKDPMKALRAFSAEHRELFGDSEPALEKHSLESGLWLLAEYTDFYLGEDPLYKPMEIEIGGSCPLPNINAVYHGRSDGIWKRSDSQLMLIEHKTTSMGVERECEKLSYSQQVEGYIWLWGQLLPKYSIGIVMANTIGVLKKGSRAKMFARQYWSIPSHRVEEWLHETEKLITDIELHVLRWKETEDQSVFPRNTNFCFQYGRCPYMNLCMYGPFPEYLEGFEPNTWDPLKLKERKTDETPSGA